MITGGRAFGIGECTHERHECLFFRCAESEAAGGRVSFGNTTNVHVAITVVEVDDLLERAVDPVVHVRRGQGHVPNRRRAESVQVWRRSCRRESAGVGIDCRRPTVGVRARPAPRPRIPGNRGTVPLKRQEVAASASARPMKRLNPWRSTDVSAARSPRTPDRPGSRVPSASEVRGERDRSRSAVTGVLPVRRPRRSSSSSEHPGQTACASSILPWISDTFSTTATCPRGRSVLEV